MKHSILAFLFVVMAKSSAYAEDAVGPSPQQSLIQTLVMVGIAALFFYIILWRPEQKRRKLMEDQRKSMKKGDKVTAMGIVGIVSKIDENTVTLKNPDGSKIEVLKAAITDVQAGTGSEDKSDLPK